MTIAPHQDHDRRLLHGVSAFKHYYVGINSLDQIATRADRVCVLNILGGESRAVTPISHIYSGGNIVCGTSPGRSGESLKTKVGDIPVYNNVAEALQAGHDFNVAVVYMPPAGVRDAVIEAVRVNPHLRKVVILTEKIPIADARIIRQYCQQQRVDVFGANCLGIADSHHHVRIGGALGGNSPEESLVPGSVAIYSNSGNFTTTIATYLLTAGWGTTVSLSSGKDVYIHFAAPEFTHAFHNDSRSKAAVMYIEPGGYYEQDLEFHKPVVACVVGRWKDKLTRACGHAGAIAGSGDNAAAKEGWFQAKLGVEGIYTPERPIYSAQGAVVTNIAHIPQAMTDVMRLNGEVPDFEPQSDLSLKCWFASMADVGLPPELRVPVVEALEPYDRQIAILERQVGRVFPRQSMKDASGASQMDPVTQVTRLHGVSVLDCALRPLEDNLVLALLREYPDENSRHLVNVALNGFINLAGSPLIAATEAARAAGSSPNTVLMVALAMMGPKTMALARRATEVLLDLFAHSGLLDPADPRFDYSPQLDRALAEVELESLFPGGKTERASRMLEAVAARGARSVFLDFLTALSKRTGRTLRGQVVLAAISCHLVWAPLLKKRLSITALHDLPWHFRVFSALVGASIPSQCQQPGAICGVPHQDLLASWSFGEVTYLALLHNRPSAEDLFDLSILLGLVASNGPGTISAQGAKGAVSADGPEAPERVQINKAYIGFLSHAGYAHGGNGFEAMSFLLKQFRDRGLRDPGDPDHGLDLADMAMAYATEYKGYKHQAKEEGNLSYYKIPCINHPVFKGKAVNYDPREVFVRDLILQRGGYNVFLEYYHHLVDALAKVGVSANVYCVNIDAVIATILLKMLWVPYVEGRISEEMLERAAFTVFLYSRMIGSAAEIEDHINRGRDLDTRTPASLCTFVS